MRASRAAAGSFPFALATKRGFENRHFPQEGFDRLVESRDGVGAGFFRVQDVRGKSQREPRAEQRFLRVSLEVDLQVDGVRREMLKMGFELIDLLLKPLLQLPMRAHALGDQIPFQCHR